MPRPSFYSERDNPIRLDRLPAEPTETAFREADAAMTTRLRALLSAVALVAAADGVAWWLHAYGNSSVGSLLRALLMAAVLMSVMSRCAARFTGVLTRLVYLFASVALVWITSIATWLEVETPLILLAAAVPSALLIAGFLDHWLDECTTSPFPREERLRLLRRWRLSRNLLIAVPVVAAVVYTVFGGFAALAAAGLVVAGGWLAAVSASGRRPMSPAKALESWLASGHTHHAIPGRFRSPAGILSVRQGLTVAVGFLVASSLRAVFPLPPTVPTLLVLGLPPLVSWGLIAQAAACRCDGLPPSRWHQFIRDLQRSDNPIERRSYYMGRLLDGSPLLLPFNLVMEHMHFLGGSGTGKTSLGLMPFIEQTIGFGDVSVIVIDLKGDSRELPATMIAAAEALQRDRGITLPYKYVSIASHLATYAFNPQTQPEFTRLSSFEKTDLVAGAAGLYYGADYGPAFYTAANTGVLNQTYQDYPDTTDFAALTEQAGYVLNNAHKSELHPEIRRNGAHVHEVLKRLSKIDPLNVAPPGEWPEDVVEHAIDIVDVFRNPQLLYFHLPSAASPGNAPQFARFVGFLTIAFASMVERKVPVVLVIDEFQRMASQNFEYMLQLARSMGVGIILSNQSLQDLQTETVDLRSIVETNTRYRQWFSINALEDRQRVMELCGETVEYFTTYSESQGPNGPTLSKTVSEQIQPRFNTNEIADISDHPLRSLVFIPRGAGYAQYGGLPFVVETDFHLSQSEYERRKAMEWPSGDVGTFVPDQLRPSGKDPAPRRRSPVITTEIIGENVGPDRSPPRDRTSNGGRKRR